MESKRVFLVAQVYLNPAGERCFVPAKTWSSFTMILQYCW